MPKALFLVPIDGPGGAERVMAQAAMQLVQSGWEVRVISLARQSEISFLDRLHENVTVSYGSGAGGFPDEWASLRRVLDEAYDLTFASHFRINVALCVARRLGILRTRRLVTRESTVFADRCSRSRLVAYRTMYQAYGAQDEIWAQTTYMADRLREILPSRVHGQIQVVPNPIDADAIRLASRAPLEAPLADRLDARPHIVWCGRFIEIKAPELAIEALAEVRKTHGKDMGLVMIGWGPLEGRLHDVTATLGLAEHVIFAGHRQNPYSIMAKARVGLLTSIREGFPNVLLEMMAVGIPSIYTTNCAGDLPSLHGVQILADESASTIASALDHAFEDNNSLQYYGAALMERTPSRFADRLLG